MTPKIIIKNTPDNPSDRVIEVRRQRGDIEEQTVLWAGQSMEAFVYEGNEYHVKEISVPAEVPPEQPPQA